MANNLTVGTPDETLHAPEPHPALPTPPPPALRKSLPDSLQIVQDSLEKSVQEGIKCHRQTVIKLLDSRQPFTDRQLLSFYNESRLGILTAFDETYNPETFVNNPPSIVTAINKARGKLEGELSSYFKTLSSTYDNNIKNILTYLHECTTESENLYLDTMAAGGGEVKELETFIAEHTKVAEKSGQKFEELLSKEGIQNCEDWMLKELNWKLQDKLEEMQLEIMSKNPLAASTPIPDEDADLNTRVTRLEELTDKLQEETENLNFKIRTPEFRNTQEDSYERIKALEVELQLTKAENEALSEKFKILEESFQSQEIDLVNHVDELENHLNTADAITNDLREKVNNLENRLQVRENQVTSLQSQVTALEVTAHSYSSLKKTLLTYESRLLALEKNGKASSRERFTGATSPARLLSPSPDDKNPELAPKPVLALRATVSSLPQSETVKPPVRVVSATLKSTATTRKGNSKEDNTVTVSVSGSSMAGTNGKTTSSSSYAASSSRVRSPGHSKMSLNHVKDTIKRFNESSAPGSNTNRSNAAAGAASANVNIDSRRQLSRTRSGTKPN